MTNPDDNMESEKIIDFIHHSPGISRESSIVTLEERISDEYPVHADIVIKDNSINYRGCCLTNILKNFGKYFFQSTSLENNLRSFFPLMIMHQIILK